MSRLVTVVLNFFAPRQARPVVALPTGQTTNLYPYEGGVTIHTSTTLALALSDALTQVILHPDFALLFPSERQAVEALWTEAVNVRAEQGV